MTCFAASRAFDGEIRPDAAYILISNSPPGGNARRRSAVTPCLAEYFGRFGVQLSDVAVPGPKVKK
jgi:hypothetical protein